MDSLRIVVDQSHSLEPGATVSGNATWFLDKQPKAVALRLFWYTKGKGTQDAHIVDKVRIETVSVQGNTNFSFRLPFGPYSFSGKLISLVWALELVAEPDGITERVDITVAPGGQEVEINAIRPDAAPVLPGTTY